MSGLLGVELGELPDWNCCGATEYIGISLTPAYALIARNLALAERSDNQQLMAPCAACYNRLAGARLAIAAEHGLALCTGDRTHYRAIRDLTIEPFRP